MDPSVSLIHTAALTYVYALPVRLYETILTTTQGEDPNTCAAEKGVTLSSSFAAPTSSVYVAAVNTTSYAPTSSSSYYVPYPTANVTSAVVKPISTGGYVSPVAFPGAASHATVSFALAFAGILGAAATLF